MNLVMISVYISLKNTEGSVFFFPKVKNTLILCSHRLDMGTYNGHATAVN